MKSGPIDDKAVSRFWTKVDKSGPCWRWIGEHIWNGYGRFYFNNGRMLAHRFSYSIKCGPIPAGHVIDHMCRIRDCVNPDHLRIATYSQNTMENSSSTPTDRARAITHCPQGHAYEGNTYTSSRAKYRQRQCRVCRRARFRDWYARKKEVAAV